MPSLLSARCRTRCCDAQGAGAVVFRINAILPPVVVAALIVRECLQFSHKCHLVPVVTRCCDASAPCLVYAMPYATRRGGRVNREGRAFVFA